MKLAIEFVALTNHHKSIGEESARHAEQLRAMDAGMRIDVAIVTSVPLGVDTPEHLEKARKVLGGM